MRKWKVVVREENREDLTGGLWRGLSFSTIYRFTKERPENSN